MTILCTCLGVAPGRQEGQTRLVLDMALVASSWNWLIVAVQRLAHVCSATFARQRLEICFTHTVIALTDRHVSWWLSFSQIEYVQSGLGGGNVLWEQHVLLKQQLQIDFLTEVLKLQVDALVSVNKQQQLQIDLLTEVLKQHMLLPQDVVSSKTWLHVFYLTEAGTSAAAAAHMSDSQCNHCVCRCDFPTLSCKHCWADCRTATISQFLDDATRAMSKADLISLSSLLDVTSKQVHRTVKSALTIFCSHDQHNISPICCSCRADHLLSSQTEWRQ